MKDILENKVTQEHLNYRFQRQKKESDSIEDIFDGNCYKKLTKRGGPLSSKYNFTYTFSFDGCPIGKSSKGTIWLIFATINELPPEMRASNMILIGVYVAEEEPEMNSLLKPFVNEANKLSKDGLEWKNAENEIIVSKFIPCQCCADAIARARALNILQFNGKMGCNLCKHCTEKLEGVKQRKYTMSDEVPEKRTHEETIEEMKKAAKECGPGKKNPKHINGVKGPTFLMYLNFFNLISNVIVDPMHCIFLGVIRQYMDILITSVGEEFYIGSRKILEKINKRINNIHPPSCIQRPPRSLFHRFKYKAKEWLIFLMYYSLPCLKGIIPEKYINHLSMLVRAVNILTSDSISPDSLDEAEKLLLDFVVLFQEYFGKKHMSFNIHSLLHVVQWYEKL